MRIKVRNRNHARRHLLAGHHPEFQIWEGEQVKAPDWVVPGTIALTTGNPQWPVRLIDPEVIVSIDEEQVAAPRVDNGIRVIEVNGTKPGVKYQVTIAPGVRSCTCPGFTYRKSCRHISCEAA